MFLSRPASNRSKGDLVAQLNSTKPKALGRRDVVLQRNAESGHYIFISQMGQQAQEQQWAHGDLLHEDLDLAQGEVASSQASVARRAIGEI